jgi:hypothetical protein
MSRRFVMGCSAAGLSVLALLGVGVAHAADTTSTSGASTTSASTARTPSTGFSTTSAVAVTTAPIATTTAPVPPVLVPHAPTWHVEGRHRGVEHFRTSGGDGCTFLNHHLVETMTLTDGRVWQLSSHYCGIVTGNNLWSGAGTVDITTDSGTLKGSSRNSAQIPSTGVPYQITISAGTGTYAGAHGSCTLDDHLESEVFGVQRQSGTFSCDLFR